MYSLALNGKKSLGMSRLSKEVGYFAYFLYNDHDFILYITVPGGRMKQLVLLIGALLASAYCFADAQTAAGFSKHSPMLNAFSSAWKNQQLIHGDLNKNDITMVYGGQDVAHKITMVEPTTAA